MHFRYFYGVNDSSRRLVTIMPTMDREQCTIQVPPAVLSWKRGLAYG